MRDKNPAGIEYVQQAVKPNQSIVCSWHLGLNDMQASIILRHNEESDHHEKANKGSEDHNTP